MENRIVIIDGNSLINRAYYAIKKPMITKNGLYTHAVYGFINMLTKIIKDYEPGYLTVAFDMKAPTFRHIEFEDYKAGRKKMPPELAMQMPLLKEVLSAMNVKIYEIDGYEADDIIGSLTKYSEGKGLSPLIITGDKDELQLVSENTTVLITKKGISEFDFFTPEKVFEKYGFSADKIIDFKGLMGDPSDNIPGVPGVGEKTAQKLIIEYGTIENLIDNIHTSSNEKLRDKILDNTTIALMSKRLATIHLEVPIEFELGEMKLQNPNQDLLIEIYRKLEFNSLLKKFKFEPDISQKLDTKEVDLDTELDSDANFFETDSLNFDIPNFQDQVQIENIASFSKFEAHIISNSSIEDSEKLAIIMPRCRPCPAC